MLKLKKLTGKSWQRVYQIRTRSKQGRLITHSEQDLCIRAVREDPVRYHKMGIDVYTVSFVSVKARH